MNINGYSIDDGSLKAVKIQLGEGEPVFPPFSQRFRALELTAFKDVKVVVLGQDPYHGEGQANGLAFSVNAGVKLPPSLKNIYKELQLEYGLSMPIKGDLTSWSKQGVLLLNSVLSVEKSKPASHAKLGWEEITDDIIKQVSEHGEHVVFMLWGAYAQKKGCFIDRDKHLVLETTHPSPFSAHKGFLGSGHFMQANDFLKRHARAPIDWFNI